MVTRPDRRGPGFLSWCCFSALVTGPALDNTYPSGRDTDDKSLLEEKWENRADVEPAWPCLHTGHQHWEQKSRLNKSWFRKAKVHQIPMRPFPLLLSFPWLARWIVPIWPRCQCHSFTRWYPLSSCLHLPFWRSLVTSHPSLSGTSWSPVVLALSLTRCWVLHTAWKLDQVTAQRRSALTLTQ